MAPAPAAAATALASAVQPLTAPSAVPAPTARAAIAGTDVRELRGRLALDRGIVREAKADTPALAVDLDHGHVQLVALTQDVLHGLNPFAGLDVRDME